MAEIYSHDLELHERDVIAQALEAAAKRLEYWEEDGAVFGARIEDRGSQITYSALGQRAPVSAKRAWDPSGDKRERLRAAVQALLPAFEVRAGGATSIDVTMKGIDKAYGVGALIRQLKLQPNQVLFVGDRLEPGGNDYPVRSLGVHVLPVAGPEQTLELIRQILARLA